MFRLIIASGSGMPILKLTAADRLDDKTSAFELGADEADVHLVGCLGVGGLREQRLHRRLLTGKQRITRRCSLLLPARSHAAS